MAYMRQNIGTGGLYPTGRAPFAADLTDSTRAITERMIKRRQEEIATEKGEIIENEKKVLEALSYEAILGASEQMQLKHLENVNKLHDKWADVFGASEGKLNTRQLHDLQKDKQQVERERVDMQTNIKEMEFVQSEVMKDARSPSPIYEPDSYDKVIKAINSGKAGDSKFNWLGLLTFKPDDVFTSMADPVMEPLIESTVASMDMNQFKVNPDGTMSWGENNERVLAENIESYFNSNRGKDIFRNYGSTPKAKEQMRQEFKALIGRSMEKRKYDYQLDKLQKGTGKDSLDPELAKTVNYFNEVAERAWMLDENIMKYIRGKDLPGAGYLKGIGYNKIKGDDVLVLEGTDGKRSIVTVPSDKTDKIAMLAFKKDFLTKFEDVTGTQINKEFFQYLEADYSKQLSEFDYKPMMRADISKLENLLKAGTKEREIKDVIDDKPNPEYDKAYGEIVKDRLEELIEDIKIEHPPKRIKLFGVKKNQLIISETGQDDVTYDLDKKEDREKLNNWVKEKVDYEGQMQRRIGGQGTKQSNEVRRKTSDGRIAIFDAETKEFIRYAE